MSARLPVREALPVRELLSRATWADLDRIAARYGIAFTGRRRDVAVERLAAVLERPDQLQVARRLLPETTAAVLGLLMLLGSAEDAGALAGARDRLAAVRPELRPLLSRVHLSNEVQTLQSLGLCFGDRRRLVVPLEVQRSVQAPLLPAPAGLAPVVAPLPYARLAYALEALLRSIAADPPVAAHVSRTQSSTVVDYQPQPLTPEAAAQLGRQLDLLPGNVVLVVSLLEALGAIQPQRGRWAVQSGWHSLAEQAPAELLDHLQRAWTAPRPLSDLARTGVYLWRCAGESDYADSVMQSEAALRATLWRWLRWAAGPVQIEMLAATLAALHPQLLLSRDGASAWIATTGRDGAEITAADVPAIARVLVRELIGQLAALGLAVADAECCALTPLAGATPGAAAASDAPAIESDGPAGLMVRPLEVAPATLRLIALAGRMLPPRAAAARYELEPAGLQQLAARGSSILELLAALESEGAALAADFRAQLAAWAERAGRVRLHQPLAVLLTDEDAPLAQILAAAGIADGAVVVGPGCAVVEPERVDAALEQLRARGFWPLVVAGPPAPAQS